MLTIFLKINVTISVALTSPLATIMDTPLFTSLPSTSDGYVDVGVLVDHLQGLGVNDAKVLLAVSNFRFLRLKFSKFSIFQQLDEPIRPSTSVSGGEMDVGQLSKTLTFELTESVLHQPMAMVAWLCCQKELAYLRFVFFQILGKILKEYKFKINQFYALSW